MNVTLYLARLLARSMARSRQAVSFIVHLSKKDKTGSKSDRRDKRRAADGHCRVRDGGVAMVMLLAVLVVLMLVLAMAKARPATEEEEAEDLSENLGTALGTT